MLKNIKQNRMQTMSPLYSNKFLIYNKERRFKKDGKNWYNCVVAKPNSNFYSISYIVLLF